MPRSQSLSLLPSLWTAEIPGRAIRCLSLLLAALVLTPAMAGAATYTVNATDDVVDANGCTAAHCSLREALAAADADAALDLVVFQIAGPVELQTELEVFEPVTIDGGSTATITPALPVSDNCYFWLGLYGPGSTVRDLRFDGLGAVCRGVLLAPSSPSSMTATGLDSRGNLVIGLQLYGTNGALVEDCNLSDNAGGSGIFVQNSENSRVTSSLFERNDSGVSVLSSPGTLVEENTVRDNEIGGIRIRAFSHDSVVVGNSVVGNGGPGTFGNGGIVIGGSERTLVEDNDVRNNAGAGIMVVDGQFIQPTVDAEIVDNTLTSNQRGVYFFPLFAEMSGLLVADNQIENSSTDGILSFGLFGAHDALTVRDNWIRGSGGTGIAFIGGGTDLSIEENVFENNGPVGIFVAANFDAGNDGQDRVEGVLSDVVIAENESSQNAGTGIFLTGLTVDDIVGGQNVVAENRVHANGQSGIALANSSDVRIEGNEVTAQLAAGLSVLQETSNVTVAENLVGVDRTGSTTDPSGGSLENGVGIYLGFSTNGDNFTYPVDLQGLEGPRDVRIANNVVAGSTNAGILLGSDMDADIVAYCAGQACAGFNAGEFATDSSAIALITDNQIFGNGGLAIDRTEDVWTSLATGNLVALDDGVTSNGSAVGANAGADFPILDQVSFGPGQKVTISGSLQAAPLTDYAVELFANSEADGSGHGEAEHRLTYASVTTDATGYAAFTITQGKKAIENKAPFGLDGFTHLAATASQLECGLPLEVCHSGRTSELSASCAVSQADLDSGTPVGCAGP